MAPPLDRTIRLLYIAILLICDSTIGLKDTRSTSTETCSFRFPKLGTAQHHPRICSLDQVLSGYEKTVSRWTEQVDDNEVPRTICTVPRPEVGIRRKSWLDSVCDSEELPSLRPSMFANVPPFINFSPYDRINQQLPTDIAAHLKWNYTAYTSNVISACVLGTGFDLRRNAESWVGGNWGLKQDYGQLQPWQKIGKLPGTQEIGNKYRLARNLQRLQDQHKHDVGAYDFFPDTYVVPDELDLLEKAEDLDRNKLWIFKPRAGSRGNGIFVLKSWEDIPEAGGIIQEYIKDPLLINGLKVDLRMYVLVTSVSPLKIFLFNNGLVRFATEPYATTKRSLHNKFIHLTNNAVNVKSKKYQNNHDPKGASGHKWTLETLWHFMRKDGLNVDQLLNSIEDIIIKAFIAADVHLAAEYSKLQNRYQAFEVFGVDILVDQSLKPWLLEINRTPTLNASSLLDLSVKGELVTEMFNIAGYHLPPTVPQEAAEQLKNSLDVPLELETITFDNRIYVPDLSVKEMRRQKNFLKKSSRRKDYLEGIISTLSRDDIRQLLIAEEEVSQAKSFKRIFPTPQTWKYLKYFEKPRYENMLLDAWEAQFGKDRSEGIQLLQRLAKQKLHLSDAEAEILVT